MVFFNGCAGLGRHADGTPGSAELILQTAASQAHVGVSWRCFFFETDPGSYRILGKVVDEYVQPGVTAECENLEVEPRLEAVLKVADGLPLFLFLDPCGLGLPYGTLVKTLDYPMEILGSHVGEVRNTVVRKAIKQLYKQGKITSDGKGLKIEEVVITRPEIR